jgi:hypothetical protein
MTGGSSEFLPFPFVLHPFPRYPDSYLPATPAEPTPLSGPTGDCTRKEEPT